MGWLNPWGHEGSVLPEIATRDDSACGASLKGPTRKGRDDGEGDELADIITIPDPKRRDGTAGNKLEGKIALGNNPDPAWESNRRPMRGSPHNLTIPPALGSAPLPCALSSAIPQTHGGFFLGHGSTAFDGAVGDVIVIDPSATQQVFEGFGTSLCWWANVVGMYPEPLRSLLVDLVFDAEKGLGLEIARYNIGGSGWQTQDVANFRYGANVPSFWGPGGEVDWAQDEGQRWVLLAARERGAHIFEAFSNSPPYWMTLSGRASGNYTGMADNLDPAYYQQFAQYLTDVVAHYAKEHSLLFRTLEPFNEPRTPYWWAGNVQEGCHFGLDSQNAFLPILSDALAKAGLSHVELASSDETNIDLAADSLANCSPAALATIAQVNTHAYSGLGRAELRDQAAAQGKRLWMSEYGNGASPPGEMGGALQLSSTILADLNVMRAVAWVYWQAIEDAEPVRLRHFLQIHPLSGIFARIAQLLLLLGFLLLSWAKLLGRWLRGQATPDRFFGTWWGLIQVPFRRGGEYYITKQYAAFSQYTRYIKSGYTFLTTEQPSWVLAALSPGDPSTRSASVVVTNFQDNVIPVSVDISRLLVDWELQGARVNVYRTSERSDGDLLTTFLVPARMRGFAFALYPLSITTFVISLAEPSKDRS